MASEDAEEQLVLGSWGGYGFAQGNAGPSWHIGFGSNAIGQDATQRQGPVIGGSGKDL
jgi:hypothetical protein